MKRALSSYRTLHRREGQCSTAVGRQQPLSTQRHPQDRHEKPLLKRSKNVTPLWFPVREATIMTISSSAPLQMALEAQLPPKNRKTIVWEFGHQGSYLHWEIQWTHTHTEPAALGIAPLQGTTEPGLCPARPTRSMGLKEGIAPGPTSYLRSELQKQPHHQPLAKCCAQSDLSSYFPKGRAVSPPRGSPQPGKSVL